MTLKELGEYSKLIAERDAIREELRHVYDAVKSPRLDCVPSRQSTESSTERAAAKAMELADRLEELNALAMRKMESIEGFILGVGDPMVRASLRHRFICGRTWSDTSRLVYGARASRETARQACVRYLGRKKKA